MVAYLRVASGKHFLTDVFGGALVGIVAGLVLPRLHERSQPPADQTPRPLMISFGAEF